MEVNEEKAASSLKETKIHPGSLNRLQSFFGSGKTRPLEFRIKQLKLLKEYILSHESEIEAALHADLRKTPTEAQMTEIAVVISEIDHTLKHIKSWVKPKRVFTPLALEPSTSKVVYQPKGIVLIISPWNYPFQLALNPLIGAIAAGNCAVVKPSEDAPHTADLIEAMVDELFSNDFVQTALGLGHEVVPELMNAMTFNHIFFTGSTAVGKIIASEAAKTLTPTTLELGGKCPAIIDRSANLKVSARRMTWGKWMNAGQTCVSPDYIMVEESMFDSFIDAFKKEIVNQFGESPKATESYPRIVNHRQFDRLVGYLEMGEVIYGGESDREEKYIAPTLMINPDMDSALMQDEIFGPIVVLIAYKSLDDIKRVIAKNPYPLAAYYFGKDKAMKAYFENELVFGGGCMNDTLVHLGNPSLPFGGVMSSGTGHYHGKFSFECFSHSKALVKGETWIDPPFRYAPFSKGKRNLIKRLMRW